MKLNSKFEWKLLGQVQGKDKIIPLPTEEFSELYVDVNFNEIVVYSFTILSKFITSTERTHRNGFYNTDGNENASYSCCNISCSTSGIKLTHHNVSGIDRESLTRITVYYR